MFKSGDKVKCIKENNVMGVSGGIVGNIYTVMYDTNEDLRLNETGRIVYAKRFKLIDNATNKAPKEKLYV